MDQETPKAGGVTPLSAAALSALHQGNKIEAIKIVRQERNLGLKEAKDAVEEYVRSQPSLQSSLARAHAGVRNRLLLWGAALAALAVLAYSFLVKP
ncbi:MAG: ribosomal protein L7/L12 [Bryobacteraceae bacterium]